MLLWGLGLLGAALLLVIIEVFIPSGGLIAIAAGGTAIAGVVCLFRYSTTWGILGVLALLLLGHATFAFALRVWPSTAVGRRMLGERPPEVIEAERLAAQRERDRLLALVGSEGGALTDLRPVGVVKVGAERLDALAETGFIRSGSRVRITVVEMNQIKVRAIA